MFPAPARPRARIGGRGPALAMVSLLAVGALIAGCTTPESGDASGISAAAPGSSHVSETVLPVPPATSLPAETSGSTAAVPPVPSRSQDTASPTSAGASAQPSPPATSSSTTPSGPAGSTTPSGPAGSTTSSGASGSTTSSGTSPAAPHTDAHGNAVVWGATSAAAVDALRTAIGPASGQQPGLTVLVPKTAPKGFAPALAEAKALVADAGATLLVVADADPRNDSAAIASLAAAPPARVIGFGPGFGPVDRFVARIATAATGVELPGGGQVMFPRRTLVALYGHPGSTSLGALGQQSLDAAITRAKRVASGYKKWVTGAVVPTFEIIATVATGGPGADGDYSAEWPVAKLRPWVEAASAAGMYVVLDLQPGRAHLLDQANLYVDLLRLPNVGLALDPEWKLAPGQKPLQQIGGVDATEVNAVIDWLSRLTAANHLPQKVLVLHQFKLSMLRDEHEIRTDDDNVAVLIHMDGHGSPGGKEATWKSVLGAAPDGVVFGWKNFFANDKPMFTPERTMDRAPAPVMISYQ